MAGVIICWARCDTCTYGLGEHCPGGDHPWAGPEDIEHAIATGKPEPTGRCGCPCASGPVIEREPEPESDVWVSLNGEPCRSCGEAGACAYDEQGRALIHAMDGEAE